MGGLENFLLNELSRFGLWAIFIAMTLESACIPIPSEVVMPYAGILVARGNYSLVQVVLIGSLANLTGSALAYAVGRYGGRNFIERYGKYIFLSRKHLALADKWFDRHGQATVFVSRLLPGVRTFISLPAGIGRMNFLRFALYSFIGSLPWNLALAYAGIVFVDNWQVMQGYLHQVNLVVIGLMLLTALLIWQWWRRRKK